MNIRDEINKATPAVDRVNEAIRENPLAAGLIGAGLAWMFFGAKGLGAVAGAAKSATGAATSAAVDAGAGLASGLRQAAKTATSAARDAASTVSEGVASIVPDVNTPNLDKPAEPLSQASTAVRDGLQSASSLGREYGQVLQSRLSESLERQPLLLGAIGLAIGAGVASTFAATTIENQWLGKHADEARNAAREVAEQAKERAQQVVSEVQDEVSRQGLTVGAAKDAASTVASKVKKVAASATQAAGKPTAG